MTNYEIMFIVNPNLDEEAIKGVVENLKTVLTNHKAEIKDVKEWGRRELAYEIKKFKAGYYFIFTIASDAAAIKEFDHSASMNEDVIRHLIINLDKE